MVFSLDYDGTYSEDNELWLDFIDKAKARGHEVICISARDQDDKDICKELLSRVRFVGTSGAHKYEYAFQLGINVDVWIDDMPECIGTINA